MRWAALAALALMLAAAPQLEARTKKSPPPEATEGADVSPEGIPADQPEKLPAGDENATDMETQPAPPPRRRAPADPDAAPLGDPGDLPQKATRWRSRRGETASSHKPISGAEAALKPDASAPGGIYRSPGTEVRITGDATSPLGGDLAEVVGHVKLERRGMVLQSDRLRFSRAKGEFIATGNVVVSNPQYTLSCGKLQFYSGQEMGVAWESPKIMEVMRGPDNEIAERMEMTAFQITIYSNEERVEGLERVRVYRMVRREGKLGLDFKVTADSCDSNMTNKENVFKGQVKVESPTYNIECKRLIFDQSADRMTCLGDAHVTGFGPKGEVTSDIQGNKIVHLVREHRSIILGSVTANLQPNKPSGARELDVTAVKETSTSEELLQLPEAPKDPERDKYRRTK